MALLERYDEVIDELLDATDLVMLDLKQLDDKIHQNLIGVPNKRTLQFAKYLEKRNQPVWIRYVVVPGYTDDDHSVRLLGEFIKDMKNIEKVELLPYHRLGAHKWEAMGEKYQLDGVEPPSKEKMVHIQQLLESYGLKNVKF